MTFTIILIAVAATSKALADTIAFHGGGIFRGKKFFDITKQGKFFPGTKYPMDGYHIFNSLALTCLIWAVSESLIQFCIFGLSYIVVFNFFWNYIFTRKTKIMTRKQITKLMIAIALLSASLFYLAFNSVTKENDWFYYHSALGWIATVVNGVILAVLFRILYKNTI